MIYRPAVVFFIVRDFFLPPPHCRGIYRLALYSTVAFTFVVLFFKGFLSNIMRTTRRYRILSLWAAIYRVLPGFTGFYRVLPRVTVFYWVLPGLVGFYWVLPGFTGFYWVFIGFH